jgi:hypothetical protein
MLLKTTTTRASSTAVSCPPIAVPDSLDSAVVGGGTFSIREASCILRNPLRSRFLRAEDAALPLLHFLPVVLYGANLLDHPQPERSLGIEDLNADEELLRF